MTRTVVIWAADGRSVNATVCPTHRAVLTAALHLTVTPWVEERGGADWTCSLCPDALKWFAEHHANPGVPDA